MKPLFLLLTLLLIAPALTTAQNDTGWPVIERCVGEPTAPPDDWTFDGTILLRGYAGIHGVNAAWETPRVVAFLRNKDWQGNDMDLPGGALSPNGRWYASPFGSREVTDTWNTITQVNQIRIYDLLEGKVTIRDWPGSTYYGGSNGQIHWLDDQTLIQDTFTQGTLILNPFSGEVKSWTLLDDLFDVYVGRGAFFSPDAAQVVYRATEFDSGWYLVNIPQKSIVQANLPISLDNTAIVWASDSKRLFAEISSEISHTIAQFDSNGLLIGNIFNLSNDNRVSSTSLHLSYTSDYLAFVEATVDLSVFNMVGGLYIASLRTQEILDPCIETSGSLMWSPKANQIALQGSNFSHEIIELMIFDLDNWQVYKVANQINPDNFPDEIIGWRAD